MSLLTIITPCYNESDNVEICASTMRDIMARELPHYDYEHIFADNASTDGCAVILKRLAANDKRIKLIVNSRNVGPFRNMFHALKFASGDAVIVMLPADLQDPPELIPQFVKLWEAGNKIVYGIRQQREESWALAAARKIYYRLVERMSGIRIPVDAGEFQLIDRSVLSALKQVDDYYPYIRGLIAKTQMQSVGVPYVWKRRARGVSKNSLLDLIDQAMNGIISTSKTPIRICVFAGFLIAALSLLYAALMLAYNILMPGAPRGIPTMITAQFFFNGVILFFLGILGEYISAIHEQIRRGPPMTPIELINFEKD